MKVFTPQHDSHLDPSGTLIPKLRRTWIRLVFQDSTNSGLQNHTSRVLTWPIESMNWSLSDCIQKRNSAESVPLRGFRRRPATSDLRPFVVARATIFRCLVQGNLQRRRGSVADKSLSYNFIEQNRHILRMWLSKRRLRPYGCQVLVNIGLPVCHRNLLIHEMLQHKMELSR